MENPEGTKGNRTHDLPACSAVPQSTVPLVHQSSVHSIKLGTHKDRLQVSANIVAVFREVKFKG